MKTSRYLDLTTIATFLSGVTASMLQLSVDDTSGVVAIGVNTLLFSSLVFSIASAINSLLVIAWRKSVVYEDSCFLNILALMLARLLGAHQTATCLYGSVHASTQAQ